MVAQTISLPNIRKLFIPDRGMTIFDADLSGADARVVAWEANDEDLKAAFRAGVNVHIKNCRDVFPLKVKGWSDEAIKATDRAQGIYHSCKQAVHASDYGGGARTIAGTLGWLVREAEDFQYNWFGLHPRIRQWHRRVEADLALTRTVANRFGYRIMYFDRTDGLLPKALAWIPQSTVAINCNLGALKLRKEYASTGVEILLQVHDSLVFQAPTVKNFSPFRSRIIEALTTPIPYDDPLTIPWKLTWSEKSWGDCT